MGEEQITAKDVYCAFRKAQSLSKGRGHRVPKDFEKHLYEKMSKDNRDALLLATKYFNTKWSRLDVNLFMKVGFELFKNFTYTKFFDARVVKLYTIKDKISKRNRVIYKKDMKDSVGYLLKLAKNKNMSIKEFCSTKIDNINSVVFHFLKFNGVDKLTVSWLVDIGWIILEDADLTLLTHLQSEHRNNLAKLSEIKEFIDKLKPYLGG